MNNKKNYIEAINEVKVGNNLKKETLNKVKEKRNYKPVYMLASLAIVLVLVISIIIPIEEEKNEQIIVTENNLPKIENFNKFYEILKENYKEVSTEGLNDSGALFLARGYEAITIPKSIMGSSDKTNNVTESSNNDYSRTNVQVEGVNEADIVKTDGEYIYYVVHNKITIVDAKNNNNLKIVEEITYGNEEENNENFYPIEIFIENNKLIVIGNRTVYNRTENESQMTYYYDSSRQYTVALTYDISKKDDIKQIRKVEIEGNYLSSRMIGNNVYLVANKHLYPYSILRYDIAELNEDDFKIQYTDTAISENVKSIGFEDVYYFPESDGTSYLNVLGFNVNNNEPAHIGSYLGAGNQIYSSQDSLYATRVKYEYTYNSWAGYSNYDVNTYIYKFKLENSNIIYASSGSVPGTVLNQFSMDESNGYFRIATTNTKSRDNDEDVNNLYILNENLKIVGKVEDLAKGEKIYSVRFMGNRAYMVTFVQTDPLFVIDLSEPTNPTVLGELKIPGYSKYLHPYDENHLIGFGEDTKVVNYGDVVTTNGMKMALFDVTDPTNPLEMYSIKIGDKGTYSELLDNHKALLFSKEKNIIAFPITISKEVNNYRNNLRFQGAIVYGLDLENGFTLKGQIAHMQLDNGYRNYDYLKEVERIIYIKNDLFTLSKGLIKSTNMNSMETTGQVEIDVEQENYYTIPYYIN